MSFTYTVSALSKIERIDTKAMAQALGTPESARFFAFTPEQAAAFAQKVSPQQVTQWWEATEAAYSMQLNQRVRWDEASDYIAFRYLYSEQHLNLRYVAAYLDRFGEATLATGFAARVRDYRGFDEELDAWSKYRGFGSRFPQITIDADTWLPFAANLVLSVPDWTGTTAEFGSLPRLLDEYEEILRIIAEADPQAATAGIEDRIHENLLAGAYNAARIHRELARIAVDVNLPLWFSE